MLGTALGIGSLKGTKQSDDPTVIELVLYRCRGRQTIAKSELWLVICRETQSDDRENREGSETELPFHMQICNWSLGKQDFFLGTTGKQASFLLHLLPLLIHLEELVLSYAW